VDKLSRRLVPDELWAVVEPLIPLPKTRPQGGGKTRLNNREVFTAITFVLTSRCAWHQLPANFNVTTPTAHRRFTEWTDAGLWYRLGLAIPVLDHPEIADWSLAILDGARARAKNQTL
jgi:transposase